MKFKSSSPIFALMLLGSMFLSSSFFAAAAQVANNVKAPSPIGLSNNSDNQNASALEREATNLTELAKQGVFRQVSNSDSKEIKQIAKILAQTEKTPILLADDASRASEAVKTLALEITGKRETGLKNKSIWQLDFRSLIETSKNAKEARARMKAVLTETEKSRGQAVLFIEDFARSLSQPETGALISDALVQGKLRVIGAMRVMDAKETIFTDEKYSRYFQFIRLPERAAKDNDDFAGSDKLSPDLRELIGNAEPTERVRVILQSDDIRNPGLINILRRNGVTIEASAANLNMLAVELPVSAAEAVAAHQGAKHLSLDRETQILGHVEATTGVAAMRALTGNSAITGKGIGIAIVDSAVYEGHHMFLGSDGSKRIPESRSFIDDGSAQDRYGHGTHVAALAAGRGGKPGDSNSINILKNYQGIAPEATIIPVKALDRDGKGTTAALIQALNWILSNSTRLNIRVVNLSLGSPAVETWRNDPVCRAVRQLTAAGIIVVAAAGNNGKDANGQKIYGAIHSPGNDPSVITVGATNTFGTDARNDDGIATYSSRGPTRSYYTDANGVKIYDHLIKPDLVAPGNQLIAAEAKDNLLASTNPQLELTNDGTADQTQLMYLSGTSMATPVVAGTVALMLQANPKLTPNMVKMILEYTAQPLAKFNALEQGAGELNVEGAVRLAKLVRQDLPNPTPLGEPLLTTQTLPVNTSTIAGTTFQWAGGILPNYGAVTGTDLITKYQKVYAQGIMMADGIVFSDGIMMADGIVFSDGIVVSDGIVFSDGTILGDTATASSSPPITTGSKLFPSSQLFNRNLTPIDRTLFADGIMMSDSSLVSDGIMMNDAASQSGGVIVGGDSTSRMQ